MKRGNIRADAPDATTGEVIEAFLDLPADGVVLERIFSEGQASPEGFWYDQDWDEWVMILSGRAAVEFAEPAGEETLGVGDWLLIPSGRRHRVKWTDKGTLWLAAHMRRGGGEPGKFH